MEHFFIITTYFFLNLLFGFKMFIADFLLQNEYMLGKFKEKGWVIPLASHCLVHATFTIAILSVFCDWLPGYLIVGLSVFDFIIHFIMDRIKASPKILGRFENLSKTDFLNHEEKIEYWKSKGTTGLDWIETLNKTWIKRKQKNKYFWWALGFDQMVHDATHNIIIYIAMLMFFISM